jgi:16S rRNA (uracil1498-N3)-methyltransferase
MFFASDLSEHMQEFLFSEEESKHCIRVLRHTVGDKIVVVNGKGFRFETQIIDANPKKCLVKVLNYQHFHEGPMVHLAVAPTKNIDRIEWLVEKGVELGCTRFSFLLTHRTERTRVPLERLEKIAVSAMKQSNRFYLPAIDAPEDLSNFIKKYPDGYIAHCVHDQVRMVDFSSPPHRMLIGPEGDFTTEEIALVLGLNYRPVSLGEARLRTETAALKSIILMAHAAAHG